MRDSKTRLAKLKVDSTFTAPCNASILYPEDGGNMHRFTAITACAVLDVLGPPYCNPEGRHCTYFLEFPLDKLSSGKLSILTNHDSLYIFKRDRLNVCVLLFSEDEEVLRGEEEKEGYAWLQERDDNPEDHTNVVGALYRGPKVED